MGIAEDYSWKSATVRVTQAVLGTIAVSLVLGIFWPAAAAVVLRLTGAFAIMTFIRTLGPTARFRDTVLVLAGLPVALVVAWYGDRVMPWDSLPTWLEPFVASVLPAWVYCLAMSWIIDRLVTRRRARAVAPEV
ncbi:hypothetical protein ACFO1B_18450 [Dactylosporangium siamense]|uniref:Uncharacterized protein n=1 Tax=Dactylosporangium siamense TaxID=685454 RepID=A0A919U9Y4_9ACTN|nr:hypothetical protein [Dactylosporangium siamense]GIG43856.1 hypothetical protein Dsi01nite_018970 [Dactylosporangium siamense]